MALGFIPLPLAGTSAPETITEDKWHQPLSLPTLRSSLAVALIVASGAVISPFGLTQAEAVTADRWVQPFSAPQTLAKRGLPVNEQQSFAFVPVVSTAEDVTLDKWFSPLREPVRVRVSIDVNKQQVFAFVANDPIADTNTGKWFAPLSEPSVKQARPVAFQQSLALGLSDPIASTDTGKWYAPLASPTRRAPFQAQALFFAQPEDVTVAKWLAPFSEPVRRGGLGAAQQQAAAFYPGPVVAAETVTVDKWFSPFAETQRQKIGLAVYQQDPTFYVEAAPFAETTTVDRWFAPLGEPNAKQRRGLPASEQLSFAFAQPEDVTVSRWLRPLDEPTRRRGLNAAQQQTAALVEASPFPETVSIDRWLQPLSEPQRSRLSVSAHSQQAFAFWPYPLPNFNAPIGVYAIYPDRIDRKTFLASEQQAIAFVRAAPFAETVSIDRWLTALSEPMRRKPFNVGVAVAPIDVPASIGWFAPLDTPRRTPRPVPQQLELAFYPAPVVVVIETITIDKWFFELSGPVRARLGLSAYQQQSVTIDPVALTLPSPAPAPDVRPDPGGRIVGGHFSRGRWRELVEARHAQRELEERAQELKRKKERELVERAAQQVALAIAAARQVEAIQIEEVRRLKVAVDVAANAQSIAETVKTAREVIRIAREVMREIEREIEDEEEAIMLLMS